MTFTLPAGQRAYDALSAPRREVVATVAARVKGKPWPVICRAAWDILKGFEVGVQSAPATREAAAENGVLAVTALIERIGVAPYDELDSPHQAVLYQLCARQDYRDAAAQYIRELGGERALPSAIEMWELNHPAISG